MTTPTAFARCLVACPKCKRQFDAAGLAARSRFHCSCGEVVVVPQFRAHDADVVRCSSCSAPRRKSATSCEHCGADYTLHERDLHTVCPACMTRVSDRARYCHHCATPIVPQGSAGEPTDQACPSCGRKAKMNSRSLGAPPIAVMECPQCAGIWLAAEAFRALTDRARDESVADPATLVGEDAGKSATKSAGASSFYRHCPECKKMMNRRNFGKRSGVVIDACKDHGLWFDANELSQILSWIRQGGEERVAERAADEARHAERLTRFKVERPTPDGDGGQLFGRSSRNDGLGGFFGMLFDL